MIKFIFSIFILFFLFSGAWKIIYFLFLVFLDFIYIEVKNVLHKVSEISPYLSILIEVILFSIVAYGIYTYIKKLNGTPKRKLNFDWEPYEPDTSTNYNRQYDRHAPYIFEKESCPKGGNHSITYYNSFGAQKRKCSKCYKLDKNYYIPR